MTIEESIAKCLHDHYSIRAINGASIYRMTDGVSSKYRVMNRDMGEQVLDDKWDAIDEFLNASEVADA